MLTWAAVGECRREREERGICGVKKKKKQESPRFVFLIP